MLRFNHQLAAVGIVTSERAFGHAEGAVDWMRLFANESQPSVTTQRAHFRSIFLAVPQVW